jgi:hypothetical protein
MGRYPAQFLRLFWRSRGDSRELSDNQHAVEPLWDTKAG